MAALLYASEPIANPEKRTMKKIDLFGFKTGAATNSTSAPAAGAVRAVILDISSLAFTVSMFRSFSAMCEDCILGASEEKVRARANDC